MNYPDIQRWLVCCALLLASAAVDAATINFAGGPVANCTFSDRANTYTCSSSAFNSANAVAIKQNYTVIGDIVGAAVTLDQNAHVTGYVTAASVTLAQNAGVTGYVTATTSSVTLAKSAVIYGDVTSATVTLAENSDINGNVTATTVTLAKKAVVTGNVTATTVTNNGGSVGGHVQCATSNYFDCSAPPPVLSECKPPANAPAGLSLSCVCDTFSRASLNPSTIFGANWIVSTSDSTNILPRIVDSGYLRLTESTGNNAKAATVPGIFPAAGNYISVEFKQYAYNGSGADGIAMTLSDYSIPAVPGAFGGSLGYAQKVPPAVPANVPGFAGGWIGIALDEYGNYQNPSEGRIGGPGARADSVGVRGSGSGVSGYQWLAGTATGLAIDDKGSSAPSYGYYYQVIVDARNDPASTSVAVNRNTGSGYVSLINIPDIYAAAKAATPSFTQAPVPNNWQVSFTGSTGGSTNIHEIGGLRICAHNIIPPTGGTPSGFNAIDEAHGTPPIAVQNYLSGHIYTKLVGTTFKLDVAALNNSQIQTAYVISTAKPVTLKLVDNSDNSCVLDNTKPNYCSSACTVKAAVTGGSQTLNFTDTDSGQKQFGPFTLNTAYSNLAAIISDGTVTACSTDNFSVRPSAVTLATSATATAPSAASTPAIKAGANFTLGATTNPSGSYSGTLALDASKLTAQFTNQDTSLQSGGTVGTLSASSLTANTAAVNATYSEVGYLYLAPGAYRDDSFTAVDSAAGDCIASTASDNNLTDTLIGGKFGCGIGNKAAVSLGRFIPDHFDVTSATVVNRSQLAACVAPPFSYMGEPMNVSFSLNALSLAGGLTANYRGAFAKLNASNWLTTGGNSIGLRMAATGFKLTSASSCSVAFGTATPSSTTFACTAGGSKASVARAAGPRVSVVGTPAAPLWSDGTSPMAATVLLARADVADGPYAFLHIGIAPQDSDGVVAAYNLDTDNDSIKDHVTLISTALRYGRLLIPNSYGSDLLNLTVPLQAQYWGGDAYITNPDDSCTPLSATNFNLVQGKGATISTSILAGATLSNGSSNKTFRLSRPTNALSKIGSVVLSTSKTEPAGYPIYSYLPGTGVETFGIFKAGPVIFIREMY